jgi:hypothetical protein
MRFAATALAVCGAGIQALIASSADASPVAVAFEGTFQHQSGAPAAIPFSGILFYESDVPDSSQSGCCVFYRFPAGSAGIRIDLPDVTLSSHPDSDQVTASSIPIPVDVDGNPIGSPADPDFAMMAAFLSWTSSGMHVPPEVQYFRLSRLVFEELPPLPDSPAALAAVILGAEVVVAGTRTLALSGSVERATPIPEPSAAGLLGLGTGALAGLRVAARRRAAERGR